MDPKELWKRIDTKLLFPVFWDKTSTVLQNCMQNGAEYVVTSGYRSYGEQTKLWAQGRTLAGKKVTNALGGFSQHNFGLAVDVARRINGILSWELKDYQPLFDEIAKHPELHSGAKYKDAPHIGWHTFYSEKTDLKILREAWEKADGSSTLERLEQMWVVIPTGGITNG